MNLAKTILILLMAIPVCFAQTKTEKPKTTAPAAKHFMIAPDQVKWEKLPASLVTGTPSVALGGELRSAVLEGDPTKPGAPFTVRLACTDGTKIAPHWHPAAENIMILSGTLALGLGDKFDASAAKDMPTGTYGYMPAHVHHFGMCKGDTNTLIYGIGPFQLNWISPKPTAGTKAAAAK